MQTFVAEHFYGNPWEGGNGGKEGDDGRKKKRRKKREKGEREGRRERYVYVGRERWANVVTVTFQWLLATEKARKQTNFVTDCSFVEETQSVTSS